jgi:hypothetical protein
MSHGLFTETLYGISPSISLRFPLTMIFHWSDMMKSRSTVMHVLYVYVPNQTFSVCRLAPAASFWKTPEYGNESEMLIPGYEAWNNRPVWSQQLIIKHKRKVRWINFEIVYDVEEEKMWYMLNPRKLSIILFFHEYIVVKLILWSWFVIVWYT